MNTKLFIKSVLATAFIAQSGQAFAAQYEIKEIAPLDKYKQHFSMGLNDSGTVVGITRDTFNFPFYLESYLDAYKTSCGLSDSELASGIFDASSTKCLGNELAEYSGNPLYQKVGSSKSFISSGSDTSLAILTDVEDSELGDYTHSNLEELKAINATNIAVGTASAPFIPVDFTYTSDDNISTDVRFWQRDYKTRAVVYVNGVGTNIEPAFSEYGGVTSAVDISDSGYVAGYSSIALVEAAQTSIETDCTNESSPLLVCVWTTQLSGEIYTKRPYIWQVDDFGEVLSSTEFGLAFTPTETQTGTYTAIITAVNDDGVGVGYGQIPNSDENIRTQPLLFGPDGTESLIDNDLYDAGYATDINSSNIVVGKVQTYYDGTYNDEFFVYDILNDELQIPTTFYTTAESSANAINDLGKVVGEAEYEVTTDTVRRKHGFIYDINTKELFDINDLIGCNSEFEIVEMKDINNNNQIAATALKLVEYRDSLGNFLYDSAGEAYMEQVAVSVLLSPISGEIETCSEDEADKYERKGLSSTPMLLIFLSTLLYIRRKSI
ncbi:hypothetical protein GCM10008107_06870 [Psychrosphaera saromensis]|uniref:Ig-like domain-containing protein n=1 Tax=Psychrosphaera saromensis TaxID=716813 RepID=A0A2S7UXH7_9GAMM|nr:DUF3466 family protein [Psychrosphaera saromensis]PQJ54405.1 hypothetical protein BTO11_12535 [Psychrosphaera saromensis]GHB60265.1 hypothetical protein GCM10008107_06870 [Psychrosphaera saromensis]GLQ14615.1 hypothetical protein GCM10007917_20700 [Psychrosphaera saromensis]